MKKLNEQEILEYVRKNTGLLSEGKLTISELSDGNINYVYRVLDEKGKMKGSALVMEFPDRAAVDEYLMGYTPLI